MKKNKSSNNFHCQFIQVSCIFEIIVLLNVQGENDSLLRLKYIFVYFFCDEFLSILLQSFRIMNLIYCLICFPFCHLNSETKYIDSPKKKNPKFRCEQQLTKPNVPTYLIFVP